MRHLLMPESPPEMRATPEENNPAIAGLFSSGVILMI